MDTVGSGVGPCRLVSILEFRTQKTQTLGLGMFAGIFCLLGESFF